MESKDLRKLIPSYTDISVWDIITYANTGGSRAKRIAVNPENNQEYFVKGSKVTKSGEIRYPMEFWSEIASSKVGQYFGFNMLDYNIAFQNDWNQKVGCISKSMIDQSKNKLTEGKAYLTGINPMYNPETDKKEYTFQFISKALNEFGLDSYLLNLVDVIVFDSLIGNSDRHQENWAFIGNFDAIIKALEHQIKNEKFWNKLLYILARFVLKETRKFNLTRSKLYIDSLATNKFSPIYDSGCCLGRELEDERVEKMLKDGKMIESYVKKGVSEIHWEGTEKKQNHFELVKLLKEQFGERINNTIIRIDELSDFNQIREIIFNIDNNLPAELSNFKLPNNRKELMIKLISLRIKKLKEII
jgi:hypothetical protein